MVETLRSEAVRFFGDQKKTLGKNHASVLFQIDKRAVPVQMKCTLSGNAKRFQPFCNDLEVAFKGTPVVIDIEEKNKTVEVKMKTDGKTVDAFLKNYGSPKKAAQNLPKKDEQKLKDSFRSLIKKAGGKYNRHYQTILFYSKEDKPLVVGIPCYDVAQAKRVAQFLKAIGLEPELSSGGKHVRAALPNRDYEGTFQDSLKKYFPDTDLHPSKSRTVAEPAQPKKAVPKKARSNPQTRIKKQAAAKSKSAPAIILESPQLRAAFLLYEGLSKKEQKIFMEKYAAVFPKKKELVSGLKDLLKVLED